MGLLKQLEIEYELDIIDEFLTHFGIMNGLLDGLIINLGNKDKFDASGNELGRIFHNIKSACEYLKLDAIIKLTSIAEDIVSELKSHKNTGTIASNEAIDWLLEVSSQLELYRQDLENDEIYFHILRPSIINIPTNLFA
ncbi:phosphorelay protein [Campylobacter fetus]|uniref:phosphorelay protein n=1 Tax=Campylobacter fetus TaxID=196 RepID=UPI002890E796|nr:phosphorelay protein [Campylobacter fetus subsp. venerealis]